MQTTLRTLGPSEAKVVLSLREQNREVVRTGDITEILGSDKAARNVIYKLVKKGWLTRLIGGRYMFLPPEHGPENTGENNVLALASAAIEPSYVGWWTAASFHGFTTQKPMSVSVAVLKQAPTRLIEGTEVRFVTVTPRKFFGSAPYPIYGRTACLSTPTKTVVDCIDRPDLAGGPSELARIIYGASLVIEAGELVDTAIAMKSTAVLQRLGFFVDLVGWQFPEVLRSKLRSGIPTGTRARFGRSKRNKGDIGYVPEWKLVVNVRESDLLSDVPRFRSKQSP